MQNDRKLLLTGGSGFIGSEVVRLAAAQGYQIVNLDFKPPRDAGHRSFWQEVDIRDSSAVCAAIIAAAPNRIVHLASDIDVNLRALAEYKTTVDGTRNVIAAAEMLPGLERFVHVSTQYVVRPGVIPASETEFIPYTVYGEAKAETEKLICSSRLNSWVIARPTIIWGPGHPSFADQIWRRMAEGSYRHPKLAGPLKRGYGYVSNTARQMMVLMQADGQALTRTVYYLGDGMLDYDRWADAFCLRLTGRPAKRVPAAGLYALGLIGSTMRRLGLPAPYDLGRYFRMTTAAPIDFTPKRATLWINCCRRDPGGTVPSDLFGGIADLGISPSTCHS